MHIEVFFVDPRNGWAAAQYDADGQVGEAAYHYHKASALVDAQRHRLPIKVFGKNGELQREITP